MSLPAVYRLWQAPFAQHKFAPVLAHNDLHPIRRVLDVGCGPGTNVAYFPNSDYLGIDLNPSYVESAKRRYCRRFLAVDAAEFAANSGERFDFILVNSLLHHLDTPTTRTLLSNLGDLLTPDGHIHILELVLPRSFSTALLMARADRGTFARPLEEWQHLFGGTFIQTVLEPYSLGMWGIPLWQMVYFKGRSKTA